MPNFLLDRDVIADLLMDESVLKLPVPNRGEVFRIIKSLWEAQLNDVSIKEVYSGHGFESPGLRVTEVEGHDFGDAGELLFRRIDRIREQLKQLDKNTWETDFISACSETRQKLESIWEAEWPYHCDGKRLLHDLHREYPMRIGLLQLKKRIILKMSADRRELWQEMEGLLTKFLGSADIKQ